MLSSQLFVHFAVCAFRGSSLLEALLCFGYQVKENGSFCALKVIPPLNLGKGGIPFRVGRRVYATLLTVLNGQLHVVVDGARQRPRLGAHETAASV